MAIIITREVGSTAKGSPLTNAELDSNFININTNKLEATNIVPVHGVDVTTDVNGNVLIDVKNFGGNCKNTTGASIPKGMPVYQTGVVGVDTPTVAPADASDPLKMPAIGVLGETIAADAEGSIIYLGNIKGVDTSAFGIGDEVYVAAGGGYTNVKPANGSGVLIQFLGVVNRVSSNNGSGIIFGTATAQTQSLETADQVQFAKVSVDNLALDGNTLSASGNLILAPTGYTDANQKTVTNLPQPVGATDAATKQYVDEAAEGLSTKPATEIATTDNLTATYSNGVGGVGATLTSTTNGAFPEIDGVVLASTVPGANGVLVKNQTNSAHNGRYNLTQLGDAGTPWVLTRCGLCDQANEIPGAYVFVKRGTSNAGTGWVQIVIDPTTFVVGTDAIFVTQFSGAGTYTAGTGLTLTGTQFALANTAVTAGTYGSSTQIPELVIDPQGRVTAATTNPITVGSGDLTVNTAGTGLTGSGTFSANSSSNQTITITSNATSANTAGAIVARDASGNFSAGTITADLTGNSASATKLSTARTISLTGDLTATSPGFDGSGNITVSTTLANSGVNSGTYGSSTQIPQIVVDSKGRVTAASSFSISVGEGVLTVNTSGTGLTGTGTFSANSATNQTITINSNATSTNTESTIVARDASGNFSAGTITANLSGNASTATTLQTARNINGVSFNGSADITIADATKLPLSGGTMTGAIAFAGTQTWPTFNQSTTGNAATATTLQTARTINGISFNGSANIAVPSIYDTNYRRITNPGGGEYVTQTSTVTGAIEIVYPVGFTSTMHRTVIKVYEYTTNESFEIHAGGYNTGTSWANNPFAYIIGNPSVDRRFTVRFGRNAAGRAVIYVGETTSAWSYPQVFVTEVVGGYSGQSDTWTTGWAINFRTAALENVTATITNCQVGYAVSTNTANSTVLRDASGNFSAGTITASLTGTASNATTVAGLAVHTGVNNVANQIVRTNGSGYADFGWINTVSGVATGTPARVYCSQDAYIRYYDMSTFTTYVRTAASGSWGITATGNVPLAGGTMTGDIVWGTNDRDHSPMGTYDSTKTQQIWSMGAAYRNSATGANFGNLYGAAYQYSASLRGRAHQFVWVQNGTATCALGANVWTSGNVTAYSDERLKTDWAPVAEDFVGRLAGLKHGSYTRIDSGQRQAGVSAQALQKLLPETVIGGEDGFLSVAYGNAALVAAVELAKRVVELEARLAKLEE